MFCNSSASVDDKIIWDHSSLTYMASAHLDCIENYNIRCQIGRGGFGNVYKAKSICSRHEVAIKFIDKQIMHSRPGCLKRVLEEVAIHSRLKHPSIIEVYSFFEDSNYIYLVLELCPFGDLNSHLKRHQNGFDEGKVHRYMCQIIEGILYLQKHRIMHRDLTLSNMLLSHDDTVKIADFGLATQLADANEKHFTMCGTPNYISPEVINQEAHGLESDIWSVGCMLYAMLTGRPPFEAQGIEDTFDRVRLGEYEVPRDLSADAKSLIGMLLQRNPMDRLKLQNIFSHPFFLKYDTQKESFSREVSVDSGRDTMQGGSLNNSAGSQTAFKYEDSSVHRNLITSSFEEAHQKNTGDLLSQHLRNWDLDKQVGKYEDIMAPLIAKAFNSSSVSSAFLANTSFLSHSMTSSSSPANLKNDEDCSLSSSFNESPRKSSSTGTMGTHVSSRHPMLEFLIKQGARPVSEPMTTSSVQCTNEFGEVYQNLQEIGQSDRRDAVKKSCENVSYPEPKTRDKTQNLRSHSLENLRHRQKQPENKRVWTAVSIDIDSSPATQKSKKIIASESFTTARLRPRRHKTKHAVITISEDGWVFAEFFKLHGVREIVHKLMKISPNGKEVYVNEVRDGRESSYMTSHLPSMQDGSLKYLPENLPQGWRKEFEYVLRFVNFIRSDTPKVTQYTDRAKCMLMENLPVPDFRAEFYSGCKFLITTEVMKIFQPDGTFVTLNPQGSITHLSPEMQKMCKHALEMHRKCRENEYFWSQKAKDSDFPNFPVTFGIKNCLVNLTPPTSNVSPCSTNSSEQSTSKSKQTSSLSDSMSLSRHMRRSASLHSDVPCSPQPTLENLNDSIMVSPREEPLPIEHHDASHGANLRQSPHPAKSLSSLGASKNSSGLRIVKCVSIPGAFVAYELSTGAFLIKNGDGSEVMVDPESFQITFPNKTRECIPLQGNIPQLPQHIEEKVKWLPMVMSMLLRSSFLSESIEVPDDFFL